MLAILLPVSVWADELTVNDGTTTNYYVPFYGYALDYGSERSQFIIPSGELSDIGDGGTITSLKFYSSLTSSKSFDESFTVTL